MSHPRARVTRRHHPLVGQEFEVIHASAPNVVLGLPDGSRLRVPRAWTDVGGGGDPTGDEAVVTADGLRHLLQRVAAIRSRT